MAELSDLLPHRHPATQQIARWLIANPNLPGPGFFMALIIQGVATQAVDQLPDSAELTAGLRKLVEAKDCFVRAAIEADKA